jgi:hypothetical protein
VRDLQMIPVEPNDLANNGAVSPDELVGCTVGASIEFQIPGCQRIPVVFEGLVSVGKFEDSNWLRNLRGILYTNYQKFIQYDSVTVLSEILVKFLSNSF